MRQREFYIRHDFSYYDSGLLALVSPQILLLYDLLRRYVWRSETHGAPEVRELLREGLVISHIKQSTLATALGYSRRQTICENMAELKKLGWVKTHMLGDAQTACFVLGEIVQDANGRRHEVFYADAFLNDLADRLDARAQREGGSESTLLSLPMEDRIEITRAFLEAARASGGVVREPVPACTGSPYQRVPGGRTLEVGSFGTTKNEEESELEPGGSAPLSPRRVAGEGRGVPGAAPGHPGGELDRGRRPTAPPVAVEGPEGEGDLELDEPGDGPRPPSTPPPPAPRRGTRATPVTVVDEAVERAKARYQQSASKQAGQQILQGDVAEARSKTLKEGKQRSLPMRALLGQMEESWLTALRKRYPGITFAAWGPKEKAKVDVLVKGYGDELAKAILVYAADNWDAIAKARFAKQPRPPTLSLALVVGMHESLALEAQQAQGAASVKERIDRWYAENPNTPMPEELAQEWAATGG